MASGGLNLLCGAVQAMDMASKAITNIQVSRQVSRILRCAPNLRPQGIPQISAMGGLVE